MIMYISSRDLAVSVVDGVFYLLTQFVSINSYCNGLQREEMVYKILNFYGFTQISEIK